MHYHGVFLHSQKFGTCEFRPLKHNVPMKVLIQMGVELSRSLQSIGLTEKWKQFMGYKQYTIKYMSNGRIYPQLLRNTSLANYTFINSKWVADSVKYWEHGRNQEISCNHAYGNPVNKVFTTTLSTHWIRKGMTTSVQRRVKPISVDGNCILLKFDWNIFPRVQPTIRQHSFR